MLFSSDNSTLALLSVAFIIFCLLAAKSKNIKSFQFQISLFIVIWIIGEIADVQSRKCWLEDTSCIHGIFRFNAMVEVLPFKKKRKETH
jgi:hypothetical protein